MIFGIRNQFLMITAAAASIALALSCSAVRAQVPQTPAPEPIASSSQPLTLSQVTETAIKIMPSLESASAERDLSAAMVDEARAPMLPSVSYDTEYYQAPGYSKVITNGGQSDTMLVLNYTLFDGGRRMDLLRAARFAAQASSQGVNAARLQVKFDAALAYFNLLRARQIENELGTSRARLDQYVAIINTLRRGGRAISSDVLKIESARDQARIAQLSARGERQRASVVLGAMIGEFDRDDLSVADIPELPPAPRGDLDRNPLMIAANRRIQSADAAVDAARAEADPKLSLNLTGGFLGVNPPYTIDHNFGASYDGLISVPVFQGGLIRAHISEAKARLMAAQASRRELEFNLRQRLSDAMVRYRQAQQQLSAITESQPTADNAFALYWTRFLGGGSATLLEVLDAYNQAEQLRIERLQQKFALRQASAEGRLILGIE